MAEINESSNVTVKNGDNTFVFSIPTILDVGRIGIRAKTLRQQAVPDSDGSEEGLDIETIYLFRALATFEVALKQTDCTWAFQPDANGNPKFDANKVSSDHFGTIMEVYMGFLEAQDSFRGRRV